jgi:hypothetical protein
MQELFVSTKPIASILAIHLTAAVTVQAAAIRNVGCREMDSVFKRKQGLGGREMIAQRKAKCSGAIEISAGRHQAVFSFDPSKDMSASAQCS